MDNVFYFNLPTWSFIASNWKPVAHYLMVTSSASLRSLKYDPALGERAGLEDLSRYIPVLILIG